MIDQKDFAVQQLGECTYQSPMKGVHFADNQEHILFHRDLGTIESYLNKDLTPPGFEAAGPREKVFFDSSDLSCGIVTCGGLCPGTDEDWNSVLYRWRRNTTRCTGNQ